VKRFSAADAKYAYSADHAAIGSVEPGEVFEVESVEGWSNYFRRPEDFTPESYAAADAVKWAVSGPFGVAGAEAGGAVAVTIHAIEVTTPGVVVYGAYDDAIDPGSWWDDETAVDLYATADGGVRFDERTTLAADPAVGCLAVAPTEGSLHAKLQGRFGGNLDCRLIRAGATVVLPSEHAGAGLYFGDCKALMGDGEIVAPPEIGALVRASAEPRPRPPSLEWPRVETADARTTLVSGTPLEWCARQAFRALLNWILEEHDLARHRAALLLAMVAHAGICQISNTDFTASCTAPRDAFAAYAAS
jgi:amidase